MYRYDYYLENGILIDPPHLSIQGPALELDTRRRRDLAVASSFIGPPGGNSVVLAKHGRIVAAAFCRLTMDIACYLANVRLAKFYAKHKWPLPNGGVVAIVTPFPTEGLTSLEMCGVDTIFAPKRLIGMESAREQPVIDWWIGRASYDPTKQDKRAFITLPFKAKEWE